MTYELDTIYVVSLGLLVGLLIIPIRQQANIAAAKRGVRINSFVWGWAAMGLAMILVVPVLIAKGSTIGWRLLAAAYTEGLPVGAVAIVTYDLGLKPLKRFGGFLIDAIKKWVVSSMDKGGIYGVYGYDPGPGGLGEEELEDVSCDPARGGPSDISGSEQGGLPQSPP